MRSERGFRGGLIVLASFPTMIRSTELFAEINTMVDSGYVCAEIAESYVKFP